MTKYPYIQAMRKVSFIIAVALSLSLLMACGGNDDLIFEEKLAHLRKLIEEEKLHEAEKEIRTLIKRQPTDSTLLYMAGRVYLELNQADTAVSYAKKLTSLYPRHLEGYRLLYEAAGRIGDYESQLWATSQLGYFVNDRRAYYYEIAELNFKLEKYGMAIRACHDILEYDPGNTKVLFLLANALAGASQPDSAIMIMERLDRTYPDNIEILSNLGTFLASAQKYEEAEVSFRRLVRSNPDYIAGWLGLGNVLLNRADTSGAIKAYREVFARDSTFLGIDSIISKLDSVMAKDSTEFE